MMGLTAKNLCDSCINTGCEFQSGIMRIECDFYIPPRMEPIDKLYTKADMMSMLTDLQLDVEGQKFDVHIDKDVWNDAIRVCSELIQQRINELEGKE